MNISTNDNNRNKCVNKINEYFNNNIQNFTIAFLKKLYLFFFRVRPYYSEVHNLYLILFNFICYPLAIFGIIKFDSEKNLGIYFIYSLILFTHLIRYLSLIFVLIIGFIY